MPGPIVAGLPMRKIRVMSLPGYWVQLRQRASGLKPATKQWRDYVWFATESEARIRAEDVIGHSGRWNFYVRIRKEV